jgi:hypothetical protein
VSFIVENGIIVDLCKMAIIRIICSKNLRICGRSGSGTLHLQINQTFAELLRFYSTVMMEFGVGLFCYSEHSWLSSELAD